MAEDDDRVARLEARVEELSALVTALSKALNEKIEAVQAKHDSMRSHLRCPSCGGRRIVRASKIVDRDSGGRTQMAVSIKGLWVQREMGAFMCHICAACGLVEWHVADPSTIDLDNDDIELIEVADTTSTPYR